MSRPPPRCDAAADSLLARPAGRAPAPPTHTPAHPRASLPQVPSPRGRPHARARIAARPRCPEAAQTNAAGRPREDADSGSTPGSPAPLQTKAAGRARLRPGVRVARRESGPRPRDSNRRRRWSRPAYSLLAARHREAPPMCAPCCRRSADGKDRRASARAGGTRPVRSSAQARARRPPGSASRASTSRAHARSSTSASS